MTDSWDSECWYCLEDVYANCKECNKPLCREHVSNDGLCAFCEGERLTEKYEKEN